MKKQRPEIGDVLLLTGVECTSDVYDHLIGNQHRCNAPPWDVVLSYVCPCQFATLTPPDLHLHVTSSSAAYFAADFKEVDGKLARLHCQVSYETLGTVWDGIDRCQCGKDQARTRK